MTVVSAAATAAVFSLGIGCLTNHGLKPLVDAFIHLQLIVHIMLLNLFTFASIESYYKYLLTVSNAEMYDAQPILTEILKIEPSDPMNQHFSDTGY